MFREESLLHVFHATLHKLHSTAVSTRASPRIFEQFFYTPQQLLRRAELERAVAGLQPLQSLGPTQFRRDHMGPVAVPNNKQIVSQT